MSHAFIRDLVDHASSRFRAGGPFAYHYARGKLGHDTIFHHVLSHGLLGGATRVLDLGSGQGSLFSWLLAAQQMAERGHWPAGWAPAPRATELRGIELMPADVERARQAFGADHPVVRIELGDMTESALGQPEAVTILDALHYVDVDRQRALLRRIREALPRGGVFLTRIGDASAGWRFHVCNGVDKVVTFARGHRLPRLHCRPLAEWRSDLEALGFEVSHRDMSGRKPFANVMLHCRVR
ncbi:MAG: class I SAM-dependent methyltransferase [Hydrogenophaga sp.]|uniref:Class I SAM-dependent methyltransferase n=1 Tax=Hydrogenophaga crocea TaxID=2716225 RepID=A0A6G8IH23_9BURK|nr:MULTISPECIES: class I SAM-dependent methyltransferase [Hydrogenophaga]MBL0944597.1 class I SAM-dependent methyltransferase [Hydrogenophaga sp.]QIM52421.1 class I SAM-dependent methyltransferase [Hydrogenophaga crocea]